MISEYLVSWGSNDGTQDFMHARQTLYQLSNNPTPNQKDFKTIYEDNCEKNYIHIKTEFCGFCPRILGFIMLPLNSVRILRKFSE